MGRLVTRQTILVLFFFWPFKFRRVCGVCSGELWLARKNNCLLSSIFFSRVRWLWANDVSVPRKVTSGLPGWNFLYTAQASFFWPRVDPARLLRRAYSRSVWIISFEFVKVCEIRFSIWESFIGFYIRCYPISTILACLFSVGAQNFVETVVLNESMSAKMASRVSYLVYYYCR